MEHAEYVQRGTQMMVDPGFDTPAIDDERLMLRHTNPQSSCCPHSHLLTLFHYPIHCRDPTFENAGAR